jgi:hypothetical protein
MSSTERCTVLPEPGTKVSVRFEQEHWDRDGEEWFEDHWVAGVVLAHEEIDGRSLAVVELDTRDFDNWTGLTSFGRVEVVGSVRVHCWAEILEIPREWAPRDRPFVGPFSGAARS